MRPEKNPELAEERYQLLTLLERWLDFPMTLLGFMWLILLVVDLTQGLTPFFARVSDTIWIIFIINFLVEFILAPRKLKYLKRNWLTAIALMLPALRALRAFRAIRVFRAARATRGLRLVRLLSSFRRGMQGLGDFLGRRGFGYVLGLTIMITLLGAAGMYAFEKDVPAQDGIKDFGTALWWTAMVITTMGSQYWPQTAEGRVLCFFLALYAFAVFGYVTASIASFFVERDKSNT